MLSHDITTIPGEVSVEIVPQIFLSEINAYDQNDKNPNYSYFAVSDINALEQAKIDLSFSNEPTHFRRISSNHRRGIDEAFHFPFIVSKVTGLPFLLACNFLYKQYKSTISGKEAATTVTVRAYAHHLAHMLNFFHRHQDEFDYLNFKFLEEEKRPASKYWGFLREQMDEGKMSRENARLHQSTSAHFFKYAREIGLIDPRATLWSEETINIQISSATQGTANKLIIRPKKAIKRFRNKSAISGYIFDGEPLRPLNDNEQKIFVSALKKVSPLWFKYLAITCLLTGARLGSIGTLREKHVIDLKRQMDSGIAIPFVKAGTADTLIQTKHDKPFNLYFPCCAINYIDAYLSSNVRKNDLKKAERKGFVFEDKYNQHLFINHLGNHIYYSKFNINLLKDWIPPSTRPGSAVSHFVSEILKPEMQKLGYQGNFTFHFLRATFAMNFIKANYRLNMSNEEINKLLDNLKDLLGHSDIKVTQRYLNHYNTDLSNSPISLANEEFVNELLNGL